MSLRRPSSVYIELTTTPQTEQISKNHQRQEGTTTLVSINDVPKVSLHKPFEYHFSGKYFKNRVRLSLIENMKASGGNVSCLYNIENGKILAKHISEQCRSLNFNEKNLAFLWACIVSREDLLEPLYRISADLLSTAPNDGLTALHLAAFSGCVASCEWLISKGLELNLVVNNLSPLHYAVLGNSLDCTKLLLRQGATLGHTSLEFPISANSSECVHYLVFTFSFERYENQFSGEVFKSRIRLNLIKDIKALGGRVKCLYDIENGTISAEQVFKEYRNLNFKLKNLAFLWSCFVSRADLLEPLYQIGAVIVSSLPSKGFTALHLAALNGCVISCKWLILNGLDLNLVVNKLSPLHCAVLGNSLDCTRLLLGHGATLDKTVLHCAVQANNTKCLQCLLNKNAEINAADEKGWTALHVAADLGMEKCLQIMIARCPEADLNIRTRSTKSTPLHLASKNGYFECCQLLVDGGADPNAVNHEGQTALHVAALVKSTDCLEILLNAGCNVNAKDEKSSTPLHKVLTGFFGFSGLNALEVLLKRGAKVNVSNQFGRTPLHLAASWHVSVSGASQSVDRLIMSGADVTARDHDGLSALGIISRNAPGSIRTICRKLDSSVTMSNNEKSDLKLDFQYLLQNSLAGELVFFKTLKSEGQEHLIEHPICKAFLYLKWQKIRKFYFCHLFLYLFFVILFTFYVIYALAHECYNAAILTEECGVCSAKLAVLNNAPETISTEVLATCLKNLSITSNSSQICTKGSTIGSFLICRPRFIEFVWYLLALVAIFESARKIMSSRGRGPIKSYFCQRHDVFEWFVILSVFFVTLLFEQTFGWQKIIGGVAVLSAWTAFMIMVGQLPIFGIYIAMFTRVKTEFFKLLIAYSCLLIGFTACFCVVFPSNETFQNPLIGFIKILAMMAGELDFEILENNLEPNTSSILNFSAYIMYTFFIIFVAVVLMNLLVGIAVHDIEGLHKTAGLSKLIRRMQLIYFLELAICKSDLPKYIVQLVLNLMSLKRTVLRVKPLHPFENRLPKEVMMAAFNLARQRKKWTNSARCWSDTLSNRYDSTCDQDEGNSYEELQQVKELVSKLINNNCYNSSKDRFIKAEKNIYKEFQRLKEMNRVQNELISKLVESNGNHLSKDRFFESEKKVHEELRQLKEMVGLKNETDSRSSKYPW